MSSFRRKEKEGKTDKKFQSDFRNFFHNLTTVGDVESSFRQDEARAVFRVNNNFVNWLCKLGLKC